MRADDPGGADVTVSAAAQMSERELTRAILECARLLGWRVAHFRAARVRRGGRDVYETPVAADGRGFPDLVLAHKLQGRLIFAELKTETGRTRPDQDEWLRALHHGPAEVFIWKPTDWLDGTVESVLRG